MQLKNKKLNTFTGRYAITGNPCTTLPCLPGVAYALSIDDDYYFLTVNGNWFSENRSWGGHTPEPGTMVTVTGVAEEKIDVYGNPYHTIEVESLYPA